MLKAGGFQCWLLVLFSVAVLGRGLGPFDSQLRLFDVAWCLGRCCTWSFLDIKHGGEKKILTLTSLSKKELFF